MADNAAPPMSTDDLRAKAANWTLAGDVGLLSHLQNFSNTILHQVEETEGALNNLLDRVEETSVKFHNISNQFLALQNSQFIENRVYEDDTPTDTVPSQPAVEPENQQKTLAIYKEAVSTGLKLLDTHYERVEVPESSDSDDDSPESSKPFLLRPKPTYMAPLPLLIGSAEWWADDSVGLGEFQENEDSEPEVTPSDEEEDVAPPHIMRRSSSSSLDEPNEVPVPPEPKRPYHPPSTYNVPLESGPPAVNDLFVPAKKDNFFGTEDLFGNYKADTRNSDLFGSSDSLATRPLGQDLFSPAENLFDEPPPVTRPAPKPAAAPRVPTNENVTKGHEEPVIKTDLFSDSAEDDGLFGVAKGDLVQPKPVISKVSNDFTKELAAKIGNAQINRIGDVNDVNNPKTTVTDTISAKPPIVTNVMREEPPPVTNTTQPSNPYASRPPAGLFDDDTDSDSEAFKPRVKPRFLGPANPSASASSNPATSLPVAASKPPDVSLFDDGNESENNSFTPKTRNLPPASKSISPPTNPARVVPPASSKPPDVGLFADDEESDDDLFGAANKRSASRTSASGLFDTSPSDDLFGTTNKPKEENIPPRTSSSKDKKDAHVKKASLFSDDLFGGGDDDDLFAPRFVAKETKASIPKQSGDSKTHDSSPEKLSASSPAPRGSSISASLSSSTVAEDLFGGISTLETSNDQTQSRSLFDSNEDDNPADVTRAADSRDLGFIESSNLSGSNAAAARDSPASWFRPQLSSTQAAALTNESSGYKTATLGTIADVSEPGPQGEKRISTIAEGSPFNSHVEPTKSASSVGDLFADPEADIFADNQSSVNSDKEVSTSAPRPQPRQVLLEEEDDDLFSSPTPVKIEAVIKTEKPVGSKDVKSVPGKPDDDLFGSSSRGTKNKSLFEDDEEDSSLFFDGKPRTIDNVSVSSSRSSIFDEVTPGKSTLPSVFDKVTSKASLFDSVDDDYDLFAPKERVKSTLAAENSAAPKLPDIVERDELFTGETTYLPNIPNAVKTEKPREEPSSKPKSLEGSKDTTIPSQKPTVPSLFSDEGDCDLFSGSKEEKPHTFDIQADLPSLPTSEAKEEKNPTVMKAPESKIEQVKSAAADIPQPKPSQGDREELASQKTEVIQNTGAGVKTESRPTPPNTLAVENKNEPRKPDEPDGEIIRPAAKKIGKLNIPVGLNINTAALLPGARLKKPEAPSTETPPASSFLDPDQSRGSSSVKPTVPSPTTLREADQAPSSGDPAGSTGDLLHSALRDRARIQVKRRPQSRRARQDALRTSGIDFGVADDTPANAVSSRDSLESSGTQFWSAENTPTSDFASPSNPLSPSTDGEDYFNVPSLDSNEKDDGNLFDRLKTDEGTAGKSEDVLFGKPPLISPAGVSAASETVRQAEPQKSVSSNSLFAEVKEEDSEPKIAVLRKVELKKASLFDDEDDNLFGEASASFLSKETVAPPVKVVKSAGPAVVKKTAPSKANSSIFDDDDDEDLFKSASNRGSAAPAKPAKLPTAEKKPAASLFQDSDDEDIFSKTAIAVPDRPSAAKTTAPESAAPKALSAGEDVFVDPLGLLRND